MFHNQKPPFTDPKVREAFAYAIDREAWVRDNRRLPDLDLDPEGLPGPRCDRDPLGLQSQTGAAGAGRIELRQRGQPAADHGNLHRHAS